MGKSHQNFAKRVEMKQMLSFPPLDVTDTVPKPGNWQVKSSLQIGRCQYLCGSDAMCWFCTPHACALGMWLCLK